MSESPTGGAVFIDSNNGLDPNRYSAITWTNDDLFSMLTPVLSWEWVIKEVIATKVRLILEARQYKRLETFSMKSFP